MRETGSGVELTSATVLIVDDSPENRYVVRRALTRAGMAVIEAGTGAEGQRLASQGPDLIVLDVNLPDTTGFELCRRIKTDPLTAHVPVIHLSQSAVDDTSRVRGLEGGADAYLTDPIHGSVLVATIRALLRMRKAEDELRQAAVDADRLAALSSRLSASRTEEEVITALLDALTDPFVVRRAVLFGPRPWITRPKAVYPVGAELGDEPMPVEPERVHQLIDAVLEPGAYDSGLHYSQGERNAWLVLPLIAYGREVGTLLVEFAEEIVLPERNQIRLGVAAERCAQALERARLFDQQRAIAFELQSSLLPAQLPEVPGVALAAEYRPGAGGTFVGGDFYDVFPSAGGWTAIIGDVCGRGAVAAGRTSLVRHTAREAARHDDDPATILRALETPIEADKRTDQLDLISAICLRIGLDAGGVRVQYAIAGHPLPIRVTAAGEVSRVGAPGPILGFNPRASYTTAEVLLAPGDALFLYTDGVTESRQGGVLFGEQRLMELLAEMMLAGASEADLASRPIAAASSYNELHDDDMATLVLRAAAVG